MPPRRTLSGVIVPEVWTHVVKANVRLLFLIAIPSLTSGTPSSSASPWVLVPPY